jgi:hypothetical protein
MAITAGDTFFRRSIHHNAIYDLKPYRNSMIVEKDCSEDFTTTTANDKKSIYKSGKRLSSTSSIGQPFGFILNSKDQHIRR